MIAAELADHVYIKLPAIRKSPLCDYYKVGICLRARSEKIHKDKFLQTILKYKYF